MTEARPPTPEIQRTDPLEVLRDQFQQEIGQVAGKIGVEPTITERLKSPKVLVALGAVGAVFAFYSSGYVEGLAKGFDVIEALDYTISLTPFSTIWEAGPIRLSGVIDGLLKGDLKPLGEYVERLGLAVRATLVPAITSVALLSGTFALYERAKRFREGIDLGLVPIERNAPQIITLFGEGSFVGEALYEMFPGNIIPVCETSGAARGILTGDEERSVYVNLDGQRYVFKREDKRSPWRRLLFNNKWLWPTKKGERLLITIGFGETRDEELPLREEAEVDLTVEEQVLGSEQALNWAEARKVRPDRVVNIHLGDPERKRLRGTGAGIKKVSDREVAAGTIDIFVGAGRRLVREIINKIGPGNTIAFETGVPDYWTGLKRLADGEQLVVHDERNPDQGTAVVLFYERHTDESVKSAKEYKRTHEGRRVMVLTSSLASHREALAAGLESVCFAEILAGDLMRIIVDLTNGKSSKEIQARLDST